MDFSPLLNGRIQDSSLFKKIADHFLYGFAGSEENNPQYNFSIPCHPGPLSTAISDAKNLHKSLFLYLFSCDNDQTSKINSIIQSHNVVEQIQNNFIFLPLDIISVEGWKASSVLKFTSLPLIALIRPNGTSIEESQIFLKHEGKIGESALLSYITIEHDPTGEIIQQQDEEYRRAVEEAEENQRHVDEIVEQANTQQNEQEQMMQRIHDEFNMLPLVENGPDVTTVRFQFPDNSTQTRKFQKSAPVRSLFVFARNYIFPRNFVLMTGFPLVSITESDSPISSVCNDRQFIIYVDEVE